MITDVHIFDLGHDQYRVEALVDGVPTRCLIVKSVLQTLPTQAERRAVAAYLLRRALYVYADADPETPAL